MFIFTSNIVPGNYSSLTRLRINVITVATNLEHFQEDHFVVEARVFAGLDTASLTLVSGLVVVGLGHQNQTLDRHQDLRAKPDR